MSGKLKMVLQCVAAGGAWSGSCAPSAWVWWVLVISLWSAVALTAYSGVVYVLAALRLLRHLA